MIPLKPEKKKKSRKGKLFVDAEPEIARIKILGIKPKFRQGIELKPGRYQIEVLAKKHTSKKEWADILAGEDTTLSIRLEPTEGLSGSRLFVETEPEDAKIKKGFK